MNTDDHIGGEHVDLHLLHLDRQARESAKAGAGCRGELVARQSSALVGDGDLLRFGRFHLGRPTANGNQHEREHHAAHDTT